jgi:triacylglycerol esterase/lipase EstA (alpha/beta hydrolase family)
VVATFTALTGTAQAAAVDPSPWSLRTPAINEDSNFPRALETSITHPHKDPVGANDWTCKPSAAHPDPVVLIHGTWENAYDNWNGLSPILKAQGYCVFALNYGNTTILPFANATGDMVASANEITTYVRQVMAATGAPKVNLIGHSQGGAQARYVADLLMPPGTVSKVIMLSASNHSTTLSGIVTLGNLTGLTKAGFSILDAIQMPAAVQQASPQAPFYVNVNGHGETIPGIDYTNIVTKYDEIVTPYTQAFITAGPGASVDNITLQNVCACDLSEHISISYSRNVAQMILNKLDPDHPHAIFCYPQAPLIGGTSAF